MDEFAEAFRTAMSAAGNTAPAEQTAELRAAAMQLRQLYLSFTAAGFTSGEALTLVGDLLRRGVPNPD